MAKQVRIGIIGFGNMGQAHAKYIAAGEIKNGALAAVCDIDEQRLQEAKEAYPGAERFSDAQQLFSSKLTDAVIIAVPHYLHPPMVIAALESGLHPMCEKPAGVYAKQVEAMNREAEKHPELQFALMFNQRAHPAAKKLKELIDSGALGYIKRVNWIITNWYRTQAYYDSGSWRATWGGEGGGVIINQCPHQLDMLQWLCGMPKSLRSFMHFGKYHKMETEDDVTVYMDFSNGATGVFIASTGSYPGSNRLEIEGNAGTALLEHGQLRLRKLEGQTVSQNISLNPQGFKGPPFKEELVELPVQEKEGHAAVTQAWINAINHEGKLVASGLEGINEMQLSNAIHLSGFTGETVNLPVDGDYYWHMLQERIAASNFQKKPGSGKTADLSGSY